jgi:hypothetical protein
MMTAAVRPPAIRYTERKKHSCGCQTVWDTISDGARYLEGCAIHYRYALCWSVAAQHPKPKER